MAADAILVSIGADIASFVANMGEAAEVSEAAMGKIAEGAEKAGEALDKNLNEGAEHARGKMEEMGEETQGLGEMFEELQGKIKGAMEFAGISLAIEMMHEFYEGLESAAGAATQINNQSEILGVTTDQYQQLALAADMAGVNMNMVSRTAIRLEDDLDRAREGASGAIKKLLELGFSLDQINDKSFGTEQALLTLGERLSDSATKEETLSAITQVFGARSKIAAQAILEYSESVKHTDEATKALTTADNEVLESLHKIHGELAATGKAWDVMKDSMLLYVAEAGQSMAAAVGITGSSMKKMAEFIHGGNAEKLDEIEVTAQKMTEVDHKYLDSVMENAKMQIEFAKAGSIQKLNAEIAYVESVRQARGENSDDYKKALNEEAKVAKETFEKEGEDALRYVEIQTRALEKLGEAKRKVTEDMIRENEKIVADAEKSAQAEFKGQLEAAKAYEEKAIAAVEAQLKINAISPQQAAQQEIEAIHMEADVTRQMYEDKKRLQDLTTAEVLEDNNAEAKSAEDAAKRIDAINQKTAQMMRQEWDQAIKPVESAMDQMFNTFATSNQSWQKTLKSSLDSMVSGIFKQSIDQMVHQWLTGEQAQTQATLLGIATRGAAEKTASAETKATDASTSQTGIAAFAAKAAAGAAAAMSSVPFVGPVLAIAAMTAMEAAVMALIGKIASAEGGMVVDKDQMAMVHEDEMILPAKISQGINEKILAPPDTSSSANGASVNNFHVTAHDAKSFEKYLNSARNRNTIMKAVKKAYARGNRAVSS